MPRKGIVDCWLCFLLSSENISKYILPYFSGMCSAEIPLAIPPPHVLRAQHHQVPGWMMSFFVRLEIIIILLYRKFFQAMAHLIRCTYIYDYTKLLITLVILKLHHEFCSIFCNIRTQTANVMLHSIINTLPTFRLSMSHKESGIFIPACIWWKEIWLLKVNTGLVYHCSPAD